MLGEKGTEMNLLVSLMLFGLCFSSNVRSPQHCLSYEPSTVTLKGKVIRKTFAGPPNYESVRKGDAPETCWILHLIKPICVNADKTMTGGDKPEKNVYEIQIRLSEKQYTQYESLLGKRVEVSGKLMHAFTAHHHTNILLTLEEMKGVRE